MGAEIDLFFWPHGPRVRESEGGEKIILLFWPDGPWVRKVFPFICMRFFGPWDSLNLTWACMAENHSPLFVLMGLESESSPFTFVWEELDSSWGVFRDQFKEFFPFTPFICMVALETPYIYYWRHCGGVTVGDLPGHFSVAARCSCFQFVIMLATDRWEL